MTPKNAQSPMILDLRVRERNLRSGALSSEEVDKYLSQLPDLSDEVETFATAMPGFEDDEDDFDDEDEGEDEGEAS